MRFDPAIGAWSSRERLDPQSAAELRRAPPVLGSAITVTADLPENMSIGGADRQPLLDVDPDARAAEQPVTRRRCRGPFANEPSSFRVGAEYVDPAATILVDGERCDELLVHPADDADVGANAIDMTIDPGLDRTASTSCRCRTRTDGRATSCRSA